MNKGDKTYQRAHCFDVKVEIPIFTENNIKVFLTSGHVNIWTIYRICKVNRASVPRKIHGFTFVYVEE